MINKFPFNNWSPAMQSSSLEEKTTVTNFLCIFMEGMMDMCVYAHVCCSLKTDAHSHGNIYFPHLAFPNIFLVK